MPIGTHGEKRPADSLANAVHVVKLSTGEAEEEYVDERKRAGRLQGRPDSRREPNTHGAQADPPAGREDPAASPARGLIVFSQLRFAPVALALPSHQ